MEAGVTALLRLAKVCWLPRVKLHRHLRFVGELINTHWLFDLFFEIVCFEPYHLFEEIRTQIILLW